MQLIFSLLFLLGLWGAGKKISGGLNFFLANVLVGYLPLFALQSFFGFLNWRNTGISDLQNQTLLTIKAAYCFMGLIYLSKIDFKKILKELLNRQNRDALYFLGFVLLCYIPYLLRYTGANGSSDSDAFAFWLPRAYSYTNSVFTGFVGKSASPPETYTALIPSFMGSFIGAIGAIGANSAKLSGAQFFLEYRIFSLIFLLQALWQLSKYFRKTLVKITVLAILVAIHPFRWVNGYQDLWLALFSVFLLLNVLEHKESKSAKNIPWLALLMLGIKNEGMLHVFIFAIYILKFEASFLRKLWKQIKIPEIFLYAIFLAFIFSWKIFTIPLNLNNHDLNFVYPGWVVLMQRWIALAEKYLLSCLHNPNLLPLPVLLAFCCVWRKPLAWVCVAMVLGVLIPISLTPQDFTTHVETAYSRIIIPGLMCLIVFAAKDFFEKILHRNP